MQSEPRNAALARRLDGVGADQSFAHDALSDRIRIVLVPGIFYADYPHTGADGAVLRAMALAEDIPFAVVPADGTGGLDAGADAVAETLRASGDGPPIVLISLSKGSAEVRHLLSRSDAGDCFARVAAWISVSGLPFGTPSFENFLRNPLRRSFARILFRCKGWRLDAVRDVLAWRPDAPFVLPAHVEFVQIAAFPEHRHLRDRRSRRMHRQLASHGPNDGFALLGELVRLPGRFAPLFGVDHYLRDVPNMQHRMRRLIAELLV